MKWRINVSARMRAERIMAEIGCRFVLIDYSFALDLKGWIARIDNHLFGKGERYIIDFHLCWPLLVPTHAIAARLRLSNSMGKKQKAGIFPTSRPRCCPRPA